MVRGDGYTLDPDLRRKLNAVLTPGRGERKFDLDEIGDDGGAGEDGGGDLDQTASRVNISEYLSECAREEGGRKVKSLAGMSFEAQEVVVAEDLLDALLGSPGDFVTVRRDGGKDEKRDRSKGSFVFELARKCEAAEPICELSNQILTFSSDYVEILSFVQDCESLEAGFVLQSLSSAVRELIREYETLILQLEETLHEGRLSLQRMFYVLRPMMKSLKSLALISRILVGKKGLRAFLVLEREWKAGEERRQILSYLLSRSAICIFDFINTWMMKGQIDDPGHEFFLDEKSDLKKEALNRDLNSSYWEQRYRIKPEVVPSFLQGHVDKILLAGKYVNVLRECKVHLEVKNMQAEVFTESFQFGSPESEYKLAKYVTSAFEFASTSLVNYIVRDLDLFGRLQSIKRYFLLDQGDFLSHFLEISREELSKPASKTLTVKLSSLLELAIRTSSSKDSSYKDDLTCSLHSTTVVDQLLRIVNMTGQPHETGRNKNKEFYAFEAFSVDYQVSWPLNLIISRKAITKYQLLFRHLFHCKYVESTLCSSWTTQQTLKGIDSKSIFANSFVLFGRMLNFVQSYLYYMQVEVIEPASQSLRSRMSREDMSIDNMMFLHDDFLGTCVKDCILTNAKILQIITNLLSVCMLFANYSDRFTNSAMEEAYAWKGDPDARETVTMDPIADLQGIAWDNRFHETVAKFKKNFDAHLAQLLEVLGAFAQGEVEPHLSSLCSRLDSSGYYAASVSREEVDWRM
ncbi:hypothetical protein NDN08_006634 [Rhodosorus marinus]|uniref:Spindle pole body component n=1 Tax=Rhodosorus marinus TaxID=101924 RepID=A0AAV8UIA6_9RHOD|nr:hypothetical protein NDN08_006634 [Rhodosorus marinus]